MWRYFSRYLRLHPRYYIYYILKNEKLNNAKMVDSINNKKALLENERCMLQMRSFYLVHLVPSKIYELK